MLINEVEQKVGLSKKSIRYYEEHGLLKPKRNHENDYRIYDDEDIRKLRLIKFLRELGVPINDLVKLDKKEMSLDTCLREQIEKIETQEGNYRKVKELCNDIIHKKVDFETIDSTTYFQDMVILNKEGFTMRDVKTSKTKKILGAVLSSLIFGALFVALLVAITYIMFFTQSEMPLVAYLILVFVLGMPLVGIIVNLVARIKEINGGEEDEASKY